MVILNRSNYSSDLTLPRNDMYISLLFGISFLITPISSYATELTSSDSNVTLNNATSLNQTITNIANQTISKIANQTMTNLNQTVSEQARLTQEARQNISQTLNTLNQTVSEQARLTQEARQNASRSIVLQTQTVQAAFKDLPFSIYVMFMTAIIAVFALPVALDLYYGRGTSRREERYDLYRALMTFGVIIVVGIVVVYLIALINFNIVTANANVNALIDVLKNLSTILGTALAAIVAFYFGAKSAQRRGTSSAGGTAGAQA